VPKVVLLDFGNTLTTAECVGIVAVVGALEDSEEVTFLPTCICGIAVAEASSGNKVRLVFIHG
jgi:hypothetical protein